MLGTLKCLRHIHTSVKRLIPRRPTLLANPGIARQMEALETNEPFFEDAEGFGDVESDLMHVHKSHKQLAIEERKQRDKVRRIIIKNKYFREPKMPNLLTYAEKEQIRLLHSRDPEEWSVEQLAESFPATPQIIQKIIEAKWRPRSLQRIKSHDEAVISNWEQLIAGNEEFTEKLTPQLRAHLMKFTNRTRADLENIIQSKTFEQWPTRPQLPEPKSKEFQNIVTSCWRKPQETKKLELESGTASNENELATLGRKSDEVPESNTQSPYDPADETYLLNKVVDKRKMRLEELKQLKLSPNEVAFLGSTQSSTEVARPFENPAGTGIAPNSVKNNNANALTNDQYLSKFESNEIMISVADQKRYDITKVKDRIYIPKKLRKKGATYRVEDCYYDDDGEFLYRVPGMTK